MKVLIVLVSLVAFCAAQTRPKPSETFFSDYEIERHTNVTVFGKGVIARDMTKNMAVENSTYTNNEMEYVLQRYDEKMEFFITNYDQNRCRFRNVTGTLPSFWDFLQVAKYVGQRVVRHVTYDVWEFFAAGVRISLAVIPATPDVPVLLERDVAQNLVTIKFQNFKAGDPDPNYFVVPPQCKQSSLLK